MNDPHVVALIYEIEDADSVDYEEMEPFVREESAFFVWKLKTKRSDSS